MVQPSVQADSEVSHNQSQQITHFLQLGQQPRVSEGHQETFRQHKLDAGVPEDTALQSPSVVRLPIDTEKAAHTAKAQSDPQATVSRQIRRQWPPPWASVTHQQAS